MNIISTLSIAAISFIGTSCTFPKEESLAHKPKIPIVYVNEAYGQNMNKMIEKCRYESMMVTLGRWEASLGNMTDEELETLQQQMMNKCVRFYKLDI